jgi:peptidoglycan/LPS O-acetylase OafA/YrhL
MGPPTTDHIVRRDIEGLRALAVLAVVVNHIVPSTLWGGFCGVDIFFVISGYLIGMHLLQDIRAGQFSFLKFYARRVRRLFPALIIVLVVVWCCGWVVLTDPEFAALGQHITAAALFANNFLLSSESGYFDAPSTAKPLLHLWSLGVEEQFYLLVPLLLWLGSRGNHGSIRWVAWLGVASLLITVFSPTPSFYLLSTRFWELGVGVTTGYLAMPRSALAGDATASGKMHYREIVACASVLMFAAALAYESKVQPWRHDSVLATSGLGIVFLLAGSTTQLASAHQRLGPWMRLIAIARGHERLLREASGVAGFASIALSLFAMTSTDWPGPQTVLPVFGTALIIAAGPLSWVNRVLSLRPLVFLGGISYPLYLWHWPIIVFYRMIHYADSAAGTLVPIVAAVLLAWCTRGLIESPVRFGRLWGKAVHPPPTWLLSCGLVLVGLLGVSALATHGFPSRYSPRLRAIANSPSSSHEYQPYRENRCNFHPGARPPFSPECTPPKRPGVPRILLWGDSHAAQLYPGLLSLQKRHDFDLIQWTGAGCPPTRTHWAAELWDCEERRAWELPQLDRLGPDTALLSARWDMYLSKGVSQEQILASTLDDMQWLRHLGVRNIVLFGPGPTWNSTLAGDLVRYMRIWHAEQIPERLGSVPDTVWRLDAAMAAQALAMRVQYVSVLRLFCDREGCLTVGDQHAPQPDLLFWDSDHLTTSGSRFLVDAVQGQILTTTH